MIFLPDSIRQGEHRWVARRPDGEASLRASKQKLWQSVFVSLLVSFRLSLTHISFDSKKE